ncbi:MAG: endonuclease MutS2 [Anaerolineae bacterium]|nr:endonuclease MutS2 [Anaerolineae bacterium]
MSTPSKHWKTLELPKILERLAAHASFSAGAEKALDLAPSDFPKEIEERLNTTSEARALLTTHPQTTLGGARDVRPQVQAAQRGATLLPTDLLDVRGTLTAAQDLHRALTRLDHLFPRLADVAGRITPCPGLIQHIGQCLDERGQVRDNASDKLARIRHELRAAHSRLFDKLQRVIASSRNAPYLQEPIITQREGRYVIPLKADFKGRIPGVVHDRSASGATLFVEPLSVVNLNNAWRELQIEEEQEVQRILADLSARIAAQGAEIIHTIDALADLDLAFAKARYAEEIDATAPALLPWQADGAQPERPTIRFLQARHPLLDPKTVVPIDLLLEQQNHVLVITGPNTGGKTVTLKTAGLLTLMAQAGLHIPVAEASGFTPFETIYADIGDEQSIEQSLSTFSSHLINILSFIDQVDTRSLVLLDELGAGTDPAEGAALARALLETLRTRGATILVATHYPELKAYAQLTPGVRNASVEFNAETLRPTYRLTIGLPGRSNAFAIARRLGLSATIIQHAEDLVAQEDRQTESLLSDLHKLRLQAVQERDEARVAQRAAQRQVEELRQRLSNIEAERAEILDMAYEEASTELETLRKEVRALRQRLFVAVPQLEEVAAVEEALEELEAELPAPAPAPPPLPQPKRPIRPGDFVFVTQLGAQGEVLAIEGQEAEVQVGPARTRVALAQLERRAAPTPEPRPSSYRIPLDGPAPETRLDLRGYTVEDALEQLDRHLDAAALAGLPWINVVHGKGTGALRRAVREFLGAHAQVASYRSGQKGEGGEGVTVVQLVTA